MTHYNLVPGQRYIVNPSDFVNSEDGDWIYDPDHEYTVLPEYTLLPTEQYDEMKDFMEREGNP